MTAPQVAGRGSRGQGLQVWLSHSESEDWPTDAKLRKVLVATFTVRAKARGRRYFEIFSAEGRSLHKGEVS